jgi:hypothetical protein
MSYVRVFEGHGYPLVFLYNSLGFVRWGSSCPSVRPVIQVLGWKRRTATTNGGRNVIAELAREPVGGEELGPLWAMTATGAGHPPCNVLNPDQSHQRPRHVAITAQPIVLQNIQRIYAWANVISKCKILWTHHQFLCGTTFFFILNMVQESLVAVGVVEGSDDDVLLWVFM